MRLLFEPALARRAARGGKRDAAAEEYLRRMSEVRDLSDPQQQALWSECDRLFHRQIALMGGDALWVRMADEIARSMDQPCGAGCAATALRPERIPLYVAEHRLIYESHRHRRRGTPPLFWWSAICSACARTSPRANRPRQRLLAASTSDMSVKPCSTFQCRPGAG